MITVGVVGVVEFAVGTFFGVRAIQQHSESDADCPQSQCRPEGVRSEVDASHAADASTALVVLGVASVALGTTVFLIAPRSDRPSVGLRLVPAGVSIAGSF
jgi:hypothetical protein